MRKLALTLAVAGLALAAATGANATSHKKAVKAAPKSCSALNAIDPDNDGAMTLGEALRRAVIVFRKINRDGDRTLEAGELRGRVSKAQFAAANPDKDGSLDMREWLKLTKSLFQKANKDGDRTVECDELAKGPGKALYQMLR